MRAATAPKPATIRVAYSPAEAAEALGLSRATVHNLIRAGEIASTKIGRSRRIPRSGAPADRTRRRGPMPRVTRRGRAVGSPGARLGTALASGSDSKRTRPGDRRTPPGTSTG
ncbi:MAG: helix-turn-helix domain-containing protein [Acidimicrobiia bacterium]|nr:helix-turn-helix domain-containing protein [Acidimicrobiia bacterium]